MRCCNRRSSTCATPRRIFLSGTKHRFTSMQLGPKGKQRNTFVQSLKRFMMRTPQLQRNEHFLPLGGNLEWTLQLRLQILTKPKQRVSPMYFCGARGATLLMSCDVCSLAQDGYAGNLASHLGFTRSNRRFVRSRCCISRSRQVCKALPREGKA